MAENITTSNIHVVIFLHRKKGHIRRGPVKRIIVNPEKTKEKLPSSFFFELFSAHFRNA